MIPAKPTFETAAYTGPPGVRVMLALVGVLACLYFGRDILIPLAFAIILSLVLAPCVGWLQRAKIGRFPAVLIVMAVSVGMLGAISYVIVDQLVQVVGDLPSYRENIDKKIVALRVPDKGSLGRVVKSFQELGREVSNSPEPPTAPPPSGRAARTTPANPLPVQVVEPPANAFVYVRQWAGPFLAPLTTVGIVLVFTLFLLVEESDLRARLFYLAGLNRVNVMTQALDDATKRVSRYLMLQFLVNAGFGLFCGFGLYLVGVPYALLWGAWRHCCGWYLILGRLSRPCYPS